jgi:hypothetical protein
VLLDDIHAAAVLYRLLVPWATLNTADVPEGTTGSVSRYLGIVATATKRWDEAELHFEDAVAMNARMGARPWLAHTHHDYARMLHARNRPGDRTRAREQLQAARKIYHELGMQSYTASAEPLAHEVGTTV